MRLARPRGPAAHELQPSFRLVRVRLATSPAVPDLVAVEAQRREGLSRGRKITVRRWRWRPPGRIIHDQRQVVAFLGTFACPAQQVWLPGSDLQDPTSWDTPPFARSCACTKTFYTTTTAPISPHLPRHPLAAELRPTQAHTRSLSKQAPKTTATASWFSRNSTASMRP
jgi:hypothetical protein